MEVSMWTCKYCLNEFNFARTTEKGNHAKYCDENPNKSVSAQKIKEANSIRHNEKFGEKKNYSVVCECCNVSFIVNEREKLHPQRERYFCSRKCSNSIGGAAKARKYHYDEVAHYSTVAWRHHKRECLVCGENKVVAVHHLNENHSDNRPENLVPLCPTHHHYMHSKHRELIEEKVIEYVKEKWGMGMQECSPVLQAGIRSGRYRYSPPDSN